ncbi:MAG: hypothetical protein GY816_10440 [Cytophagales bacterium]|nr:hypothetical protein [Cytophagales bacterium]
MDTLLTKCYNRQFKLEEGRKLKKLHALHKEAAHKASKELWPNREFRNSLIVNLTETEFSEDELNILALGPKFCATQRKAPISDIVASVESALYKIPRGNVIAASVAKLIHSHHKNTTHNLSLGHLNAISTIKSKLRQDGLIINNADKGAKTVIMKLSEYKQKMLSQLNDEPETKEELQSY